MPWTGSAPNKTYVRSDGVRTGAAINTTAKGLGINNTSELADTREQDMAEAISLALTIDGGTQPTVDLPMNTYKHTGVGAGTARTHYARLDQVQDNDFAYAEAGGTANAITLTTGITVAPSEGLSIEFIAEADNTAATTINLNANGDVALQVYGAACVGGEIQNGQAHRITFDGTQWQLQNSGRLDNLDKTDGNFLVGDGTKWVTESGATARTSLGLGTGDSPQFTAVNIGAASDTTITRTGAGDIAVEGNGIYRAGGTDVAIADGGTGASTAATAFTALKQAASDTDTGVIEIATQAEMETGTDVVRAVTPGRQPFHPSHPKAFAKVNLSSGTPTLNRGFNVSSLSDTGTGAFRTNFTTAFSAADYGTAGHGRAATDSFPDMQICGYLTGTYTTASFEVICQYPGGVNVDTQYACITFMGDL